MVNQLDVQQGFNSSSILNSAKNNQIIPGYEPLSVGYHGDNGCIYQNLSKNACLENLILRAQQDSEQLLEDAQNDASLFDISNQLVYGGAYGPCFKSGDSVGCGILQTAPGEVCIYFTINGLRLPGVRMKSTGFNFYPVVSMKGKLCHFEVVKSVKQFHHN